MIVSKSKYELFKNFRCKWLLIYICSIIIKVKWTVEPNDDACVYLTEYNRPRGDINGTDWNS